MPQTGAGTRKLAIGHAGASSSWARRIPRSLRGCSTRWPDKHLPLAGVAQCLGEIGEAAPDVKPAIVDSLLAYVRQDQGADSYALASAIGSLVRLGYTDDAVIDRLLALYGRGDDVVRGALLAAAGDYSAAARQGDGPDAQRAEGWRA